MKATHPAVIWCLAVAVLCTFAVAGEEKAPGLPKPQMEGGMPLMQALKNRQTIREYGARAIPEQVLSNLLWAADGINRPDSGKRTAPSAMNWQEIDIYVATEKGLSLYDAKAHALVEVLTEDVRMQTGRQGNAPLVLIYVADGAKMGTRGSQADRDFYSACDTGFISQNVYLFCASEGLATVVRGGINRETLSAAMKLRPEQKIILCQNVGYPKPN